MPASTQIVVRIPTKMHRRIQRLAVRLARAGEISRPLCSEVVRRALAAGLQEIDRAVP